VAGKNENMSSRSQKREKVHPLSGGVTRIVIGRSGKKSFPCDAIPEGY